MHFKQCLGQRLSAILRRKNHIFRNVVLIVFLCFSILQPLVFADESPISGRILNFQPASPDAFRTQIDQFILGGSGDDIQRLFGDNLQTLSWPPPPRIWADIEQQQFVEAEVFLGPNGSLGPVTATAKQKFNYQVGTSFMFFSSLRNATNSNSRVVSTNPVPMRSFTVYDPRTAQVYLDVNDQFPAVGMCAYRIVLTVEQRVDGGINFLWAGTSGAVGRRTVVSLFFFSNFFQILRNRSVEYYQNEVCQSEFIEFVKPSIDADFGNIVRSLVTLSRSTCQPTSGALRAEGDESCQVWFNENFGRRLRRATVPRCVQNTRGEFHCALRSREGKSCPLYYNARGNFVSENYQSIYSRFTPGGPFENRCDTGLRCQMEGSPLFIPGFGALGFGFGMCRPN